MTRIAEHCLVLEQGPEMGVTRRCRHHELRRRRGFHILDLLMVIGIIALLLSILLPAMARAREQSKYVRWQAFSRDLSMDPNMAAYYTFQNDRGGISLTNSTVANENPSYLPPAMDLTLYDQSTGLMPVSNPQMISDFWANDGRFKNKPAATFSQSGADGNLMIYPTRAQGSGILGSVLRKSQAITIATWINVPPALVGQKGAIVYWTDPNGKRIFDVQLPWQNLVSWMTYGWPSPNYVDVPFTFGPDSPWSLWCFTKDNHTGLQKVYLNGQLIAAVPGFTNANTPWENFCSTTALPLSNSYPSNFRFGGILGYGNCGATIDEFAIFDADLSPNDVTPDGTIIPGVVAQRFVQMYDMGAP
jgi:competence protein ComGC